MTKYFTIIISLLFSGSALAGPKIPVCIDGDCETKLHVKITDEAWSEIETVFSNPITDDKQERDYIAKAYAIIEKDVFTSLSKKANDSLSPAQVHERMNDRDEAYNSKTFISLLMDNHLATRYYLRKTEKRKSWLQLNEHAIIIQSRGNAKTYAINTTVDGYGIEPKIEKYHNWLTAKSYSSLPKRAFELFIPPDNTFKQNDE